MEDHRFDLLAKSLNFAVSRRGLGWQIGALPILGLLVPIADPEAIARRAQRGSDVGIEACIPTGKKCPSPKPRGKKAKKLSCQKRCCQHRVLRNAKGQRKCACEPNGGPCLNAIECCTGACNNGICGPCGNCTGVCQQCIDGACGVVTPGTPCVDPANPECVAPTDGCACFDGECIFIPVSDRALKADFAPVDTGAVLAQVSQLPIQTWRYREEDAPVRHIGPMAQDFASVFGVGSDDRRIHVIDGQGVALAAIQALHREVQTLAARLAALEAANADSICLPADTLEGGAE